MTTVISADGDVVTIGGGDLQPFPRGSVPLSLFGGGYGSVGMIGDGRTVSYANLYRTQLWVGVATNKLARGISRLPLKVYKRTANGRERVRDGRLAELLYRPWARGTAIELKQALSLPTLVHGNSSLRKIRRKPGQPPVAFEPLMWSLLRAHRQQGGPVDVWETSQPLSDGKRFLDPDDVVHVAWRGLDGPIGISPLSHLAVTVQIEDATQRYQKAMWRNAVRPSTAIEADEKFLTLDDEVADKLLAQLRGDLSDIAGPDYAGEPFILPPGLKMNAIGHTAVEAELISQRKLTREEVAACYDVPAPLIGLLERSTFNNITELHRMFYVTVLGPWLTLIAEQLQAQLVDSDPTLADPDIYVEFDLSEVLKGDLLQRSMALALQIAHGVLTIDEAREIENRTTFGLPETSLPLYPSNNLTPAKGAAASKEAVTQAAAAFSQMGEADVRKLLAASSGSVVEAIFELAGVTSPNGSHEDPDDEDLDDADVVD